MEASDVWSPITDHQVRLLPLEDGQHLLQSLIRGNISLDDSNSRNWSHLLKIHRHHFGLLLPQELPFLLIFVDLIAENLGPTSRSRA
mmetsp:Transcript_5204/g.4787  ORF Transcript_5204/g.4787 Transcript_5204/m.4787 type:complete len:87 (-) Transcript_5204:158-418(-)